MKTFKNPKKFEAKSGITNDALYLFGPEDWQKEITSSLKKLPVNCCLAGDKVGIWDIEVVRCCEIVGLNLVKGSDPTGLLFLLSKQFCQFCPEVYVLIGKKYEHADLIEKIAELNKSIMIVEDNTKIVEAFAYLNEVS